MRGSPIARRAAAVTLTTLAVLSAFAASVSARETVQSDVDLAGGVKVAGPDVYYRENEADGKIVLRSARPGGEVRDVTSAVVSAKCQEDGEFQDCDSTGFGFDVSAARLAFSNISVFQIADKPNQFKVSTGPLSGPFSTLVNCDKTGAENFYGYVVDGNSIAYDTNECTDGMPGQRIAVRSFAPGAPAPRTFPSDRDTGFDFAGNRIALQRGNAVKVFDTDSGAPLFSTSFPGGDIFDVAIQADGTVVVGQGINGDEDGPPLLGRTRKTRCFLTYSWASIAQPTPHEISACGQSGVEISSNRLFFLRNDTKTTQLVSSDLAGELSTIASVKPDGIFDSGDSSSIAGRGFDVEGSRVAYSLHRCLGETIYTQDLPAPNVTTDETVACDESISRKTVKVSKSGAATVTVKCPKGCVGTLENVQTDPKKGDTISLVVAQSVPVRIESGVEKIKIQLTKKARKALRKNGKLRVQTQLFGPPFGAEAVLTFKRG